MEPMSDLVTFIEARLAEDEQVARTATGAPWRWVDPGGRFKQALTGADGELIAPIANGDVYPATYDAEHIVRHDPSRVLREVAAKRKAIATHRWHGPDGCEEDRFCPLLTAMASVWSDHPDFRQEWSPDVR